MKLKCSSCGNLSGCGEVENGIFTCASCGHLPVFIPEDDEEQQDQDPIQCADDEIF